MAPENGCWKLVSFWVPAYFQVGPYDRYKWSYNPYTRLYDYFTQVITVFFGPHLSVTIGLWPPILFFFAGQSTSDSSITSQTHADGGRYVHPAGGCGPQKKHGKKIKLLHPPTFGLVITPLEPLKTEGRLWVSHGGTQFFWGGILMHIVWIKL